MMRFSLITLTALSVPSMMASAYQVGGFDVFGRPYLVSPRGRYRVGREFRSNDPCAPRQSGWKNSNDCAVDKTFEDLAKELKEDRDRRARMFNELRQRGRAPQQLDDDALRQQEKWVNRAFGLAEDVAKGMATSPREVKEAKESIRQTKEFVDSIFGFAQDVSSGGIYTTVRSEVVQDNDQVFQVAVDVPGVKADDIDVAVEGAKDKVLVIRGKRELRGGAKKNDTEAGTGANRKEFRKVFALDSSSVIEKISVVLENGVLTLTVPRDTAQKIETTVKIPVTKLDGDSSAASEDNPPFELELDLPGVSAANIEISVEGDSDKALVITATRQLTEKASDGSLKTKQLSKRFTIDEIVDTTKLTATLSNGVLRVTAPADEKKKEDFIRKIEVTQTLDSPGDQGDIQVQAPGTEDDDNKVENNEDD